MSVSLQPGAPAEKRTGKTSQGKSGSPFSGGLRSGHAVVKGAPGEGRRLRGAVHTTPRQVTALVGGSGPAPDHPPSRISPRCEMPPVSGRFAGSPHHGREPAPLGARFRFRPGRKAGGSSSHTPSPGGTGRTECSLAGREENCLSRTYVSHATPVQLNGTEQLLRLGRGRSLPTKTRPSSDHRTWAPGRQAALGSTLPGRSRAAVRRTSSASGAAHASASASSARWERIRSARARDSP